MGLLSEFAEKWKLKVEGDRIPGSDGFIVEHDGQLWCWTHSHTPDCGHKFFPIRDDWHELEAFLFMVGRGVG